jgi:hypothetical protein
MTLKRVALLAGCLLAPAVRAAETPTRPPLTAEDQKAIARCLEIIRGCQLPDGAFNQVDHGRRPGAHVWVAPYFVQYAALALLAGHERNPNPADLRRVGAWLDWCARNQAAEGYWNDFTGTVEGYRNNGKVDAWDSSAALYLLVAGRYQRAGGKVTPAIAAAARKALRCIESVTDEDGLSWATPKYRVKFLLDNIEVYAGLRSAAGLFAAVDAPKEARRAREMADKLGKKLPDYWQAEARRFAYALHENGTFEGGLDKLYPHGLAQLFGVSFVAPKAEVWASMQTFKPDGGPSAAAGPERWLVAAARLGGDRVSEWRTATGKEVGTFAPDNVYIYRPAVAALGLLQGAGWMPSIAAGK